MHKVDLLSLLTSLSMQSTFNQKAEGGDPILLQSILHSVMVVRVHTH